MRVAILLSRRTQRHATLGKFLGEHRVPFGSKHPAAVDSSVAFSDCRQSWPDVVSIRENVVIHHGNAYAQVSSRSRLR
jgi:hypothetical protein